MPLWKSLPELFEQRDDPFDPRDCLRKPTGQPDPTSCIEFVGIKFPLLPFDPKANYPPVVFLRLKPRMIRQANPKDIRNQIVTARHQMMRFRRSIRFELFREPLRDFAKLMRLRVALAKLQVFPRPRVRQASGSHAALSFH
jgi:hypothetical protein